MSNLKEEIKSRITLGMKSRNPEIGILRVLLGEIQLKESKDNSQLKNETVYKIINKLIESNNLVNTEKTQGENLVLSGLLPAKMTEKEIKEILRGNLSIKEEVEGKAIGLAMKIVKDAAPFFANKMVDGGVVAKVVKEIRGVKVD